MSNEEEDLGKGCFWISAGIALVIIAVFAGLALLKWVTP